MARKLQSKRPPRHKAPSAAAHSFGSRALPRQPRTPLDDHATHYAAGEDGPTDGWSAPEDEGVASAGHSQASFGQSFSSKPPIASSTTSVSEATRSSTSQGTRVVKPLVGARVVWHLVSGTANLWRGHGWANRRTFCERLDDAQWRGDGGFISMGSGWRESCGAGADRLHQVPPGGERAGGRHLGASAPPRQAPWSELSLRPVSQQRAFHHQRAAGGCGVQNLPILSSIFAEFSRGEFAR